MIPAAVLLILMFLMPESPRWHLLKVRLTDDAALKHRHYEQAFLLLWRLRHTSLQAGRDLILLDKLIDVEMEHSRRRNGSPAASISKVSAFRAPWTKHKAL